MIVENVNTHAHDEVHLVVLAYLRRRWSLSGRDGFGTLFLSWRACEAGFSKFLEVFFTVFSAPDAGFGCTGHWLREHRTLAVCSVNTPCCNLARTKHWMLRYCCTGCWSGTVHASGGYVTSTSSSNPCVHQRSGVRWPTVGRIRWAKIVSRRVRCSLKWSLNFECARHVARSGAPDAAGASDACASERPVPPIFAQRLYSKGYLYIYMFGRLRGLSWIFWHPNIFLSLAYSLPLISLTWLTNQSEFEWY
jgi:hypothetical protein